MKAYICGFIILFGVSLGSAALAGAKTDETKEAVKAECQAYFDANVRGIEKTGAVPKFKRLPVPPPSNVRRKSFTCVVVKFDINEAGKTENIAVA